MPFIPARRVDTTVVSGAGAVLLDEQQLTADGAITFENIPDDYADLVIVLHGRSTHTDTDQLTVRLGSGTVDSGAAAYGWGGHLAGEVGNTEFFDVSDSEITATGLLATSGGPLGSVTIHLPDYSRVGGLRTVQTDGGFVDVGGTVWRRWVGIGTWDNTADAIDVIMLDAEYGTLEAGSVARLYGWGLATVARDFSDGGDPTTVHTDWSDGGTPSTVHADYSTGGSP